MIPKGYFWNSDDFTLSVPVDKVQNLKILCDKALSGPVSLRYLQRILGTIESFKIAFPHAALRYRALQRDVASHISKGASWDLKILPSALSLRDLHWWKSCPVHPPRPLTPFSPHITVTTDSSLSGWGAFSSSGQEAFGFWTEEESSLHINALESKAVLFSFLSFFRDVSDTSILVQSDNKTTIAYINHMGGVKSSVISDIIFDLYEFCLPRNIIIKTSFLKGDHNTKADALSRQEKDSSFSLPHSLFCYFCEHFSLSPDIDLFASRLNKKLDCYYSKGPDPFALGFNSLLMNWNGIVYAFPPIKLVGKFLNKFLHENAHDAILISPYWPSQPYFPTLLELLANNPILFPVSMLENAS